VYKVLSFPWWHVNITVGRWTADHKVVGSIPDRSSGYCVDGDCLWTGKPSRYLTSTKDNSASDPCG